MEMTDILTAMAWRIRSRLSEIDLPYVDAEIPMGIDQWPACLLLATGEFVVPTVKRQGGSELWVQPVTAKIIVPMQGETPQEFNITRRLLPLVWDAFPVVTGGASALFDGSGLAGHLDRCLPVVPRFDRVTEFGGQLKYATSEIEFDIKFHRYPSGA